MNQNIAISENASRQEAFEQVANYLESVGLSVSAIDDGRPWGGFFCIENNATERFIHHFFAGVPEETVKTGGQLSPKILLVEQGKRLSWQYHHRRAEVWKVIGGTVQVVQSETDEPGQPSTKELNDLIVLRQGQRHRLIGTNEWGVIAEIWQHTDAIKSDENDIVRVQDDFGR